MTTFDATPPSSVALVAIGGAIGTLLRYAVSLAAPVASATFPTTTFVINITGAFALGLLLGVLARRPDGGERWRLLIGVGGLGGYTTFSTVAVETVQLTRADRPLVAALYVGASVVAGLLAARIGERVTGVAPSAIVEDEA